MSIVENGANGGSSGGRSSSRSCRAQALPDNQRGDNYTVLTVASASVLYFTAISERMRTPRGRSVRPGLGIVLLVAAAALQVKLPKLI